MSDKEKEQSNLKPNLGEIEEEGGIENGEEVGLETGNQVTGKKCVDLTEAEKDKLAYQMWLEESDPDDPDYVYHEEGCDCEDKNTEDGEEETSSEEEETESDEEEIDQDAGKRSKRKGDKEEKESDKKKKSKKKKSRETEEDI